MPLLFTLIIGPIITIIFLIGIATSITTYLINLLPKKFALIIPIIFLILAIIFYLISKITYDNLKSAIYIFACGISGAFFIYYFLTTLVRKEEQEKIISPKQNNTENNEIEILNVNDNPLSHEDKLKELSNIKENNQNNLNNLTIKNWFKK